jgi:hypothetical protein
MEIYKLDGQFVVIDDTPVKEGYCLDIEGVVIIYYNGDYGEITPPNFKKITHSSPHLFGTKELKLYKIKI